MSAAISLRFSALLRVVLLCIAAASWLAGCSSLPTRETPAPTHAMDGGATPLGRLAQESRPSDASASLSGFRLLSDPGHAFDARLALIRAAQQTLDVQYYVLEHDVAGELFLNALRAAAARGVRVRLIVDDLHVGDKDGLFRSLADNPHFEVRLFNPLPARGGTLVSRVLRSLYDLGRIHRRMHNKLFIADNSVSISGGRNIAADYFMRSGVANFIDIDVVAAGPIVQEQSQAFDRYWNSEQVYAIAHFLPPGPVVRADPAAPQPSPPLLLRDVDRLGQTPVSRQLQAGRLTLFWASARLFTDDPAKITRTSFDTRFAGSVSERTLGVIRSAQRTVLISSPYFIPGDIGLEVMRHAADSKVATTVVTNSLAATDEPLVYVAYARQRTAMLKLGVTLYEIGPTLASRSGTLGDFGQTQGRLHAKLAIVDERYIYVGSMNLDGRSASFNTETGLLIDSPALAENFGKLVRADNFRSSYRLRLGSTGGVEWIEQDGQGRQVVHTTEPDASWAGALRHWFMSLFVHEEFL